MQYEQPTESTEQTARIGLSSGPSAEAGDLRSVERLLAVLEKRPEDPFALPRRQRKAQVPVQPTAELAAWNLPPLPTPSTESKGGFLAWLFLSFGLMAFTCGGVMLVWSVVEGREELWSFGIPLALGGQGGIIFGLIGLAEAASQRHKQASAALEDYRQRVALLQNLAFAGQQPSRRAA